MNFTLLFLLIALVLFVWGGAVALTWVTVGNYGALIAFGLASFVVSHLPPWPWR